MARRKATRNARLFPGVHARLRGQFGECPYPKNPECRRVLCTPRGAAAGTPMADGSKMTTTAAALIVNAERVLSEAAARSLCCHVVDLVVRGATDDEMVTSFRDYEVRLVKWKATFLSLISDIVETAVLRAEVAELRAMVEEVEARPASSQTLH